MNAGSMRRVLGIMALATAIGARGDGDDGTTGPAGTDGAPSEGAVDYSVDYDGPDSRVPGSSELEALLLTLDDMPDGWLDLETSYTAVEVCLRTEIPEADGADQYPTGAVAFAADESSFMPDVFEKIVAVPEGQGAAVFDYTRRLLAICGNGGEVDGLAHLGAKELVVPTLGDETIGRRITIQRLGTQATVGIDVLYARAGDTIVAVGVVEPDGQIDRLVELATLAFDRATAT